MAIFSSHFLMTYFYRARWTCHATATGGKTLATMMGAHLHHQPEKAFCCFGLLIALDNCFMASTGLLRSFNWVGHLYYRLDNLLKVCVLNVCTIHTFTVGCREIIYSVQCGLRVRTGVQGKALEYTSNFNKKLIISCSGFREMGL